MNQLTYLYIANLQIFIIKAQLMLRKSKLKFEIQIPYLPQNKHKWLLVSNIDFLKISTSKNKQILISIRISGFPEVMGAVEPNNFSLIMDLIQVGTSVLYPFSSFFQIIFQLYMTAGSNYLQGTIAQIQRTPDDKQIAILFPSFRKRIMSLRLEKAETVLGTLEQDPCEQLFSLFKTGL